MEINMPLTPLTADVENIIKLEDNPIEQAGMTPAILKSRFDKGSQDIKYFLNNTLIPQLDTALADKLSALELMAASQANLAAAQASGVFDGREIELNMDSTHIRWRYAGDTAWTALVPLETIRGPQGLQGIQGFQGIQGQTGNAVESVSLLSGTHAAGTMDTYRITFTDDTTHDFSVYNGADGEGAGDMLKSAYDPTNKNADAFNMANMVEGTTNKILTAAERTKLAGIAAGAEVNVNADWNAGSGDAQILNKPAIPAGGTPTLTLGTSSAAGSAATFVRTDASILAFDATAPSTQAFGDAASAGTASVAARRDHKHAMPTAQTLSAFGGGYAVCATAAATVAKTLSITGYALVVGGIVGVKFTNGNSAASPTLNISSTGAKPIFIGGAAAGAMAANYTAYLQYDGTNYNMLTTPVDVVMRQGTAPANTTALWIDTANSDIPKYYNGSAWVPLVSVWG
jgi:hypothetical protein